MTDLNFSSDILTLAHSLSLVITDWTLAKGFKLKAGKVSFEVPAKLKSRDDYIVVLFGDSGNRSKKFSITSVGDI